MLQKPVAVGHVQRAVNIKRILPEIWGDFDGSLDAVKPFVVNIGAFSVKQMRSNNRRRITHFPYIAAVPESGHAQFAPLGIIKNDVELHLIERVNVRHARGESLLDHDVGFGSQFQLGGLNPKRHADDKA